MKMSNCSYWQVEILMFASWITWLFRLYLMVWESWSSCLDSSTLPTQFSSRVAYQHLNSQIWRYTYYIILDFRNNASSCWCMDIAFYICWLDDSLGAFRTITLVNFNIEFPRGTRELDRDRQLPAVYVLLSCTFTLYTYVWLGRWNWGGKVEREQRVGISFWIPFSYPVLDKHGE
jgi:hypothetical protein